MEVWDVDGGRYNVTPEEYGEMVELDVSPSDFLRYKEMITTADDIRRGLPDMPLADGVVEAMKAKTTDLLAAIRMAGEDNSEGIPLEDVRRAMRDQYFLFASIGLTLGAYDSQEAIERHYTFAYPRSMKHLNKGRFESRIAVRNETLTDEGDFVEVQGEDRDYKFEDGFGYTGMLTITIDPAKRIEFSYKADQQSARQFHESTTEVRNGKHTTYNNDDMSLRIDIDPTAPAGIAMDFGRSKFHGDKLSREGDLLGKVYSLVTPETGSHEYTGFTPEMKDQFAPFAEEIMLQQYFYHKWQDDEQHNRIPMHLFKAGFQRYLAHNYPDSD